MSTRTWAVTAPESLPYTLDHDAWVRHLCEHLLPEGQWRPREFDPDRGHVQHPHNQNLRVDQVFCVWIAWSYSSFLPGWRSGATRRKAWRFGGRAGVVASSATGRFQTSSMARGRILIWWQLSR
jgi:hypothetical protein